MRKILLLLALFAPAHAVGIRVATFNVGAHFTESSGGVFYPEFGLGAAGTPDHESVKAILDRIDADVVALQEIDSADSAGSPNDVQKLAMALGYSHVYIAPHNGSGGLVAPFDSDLRVAFLSRHPFLTTTAIRSPAGAKELTRLHAAVKVDVPGTTRDPVILNCHLKPGGSEDRFRRAVEMKRLVGHLTTLGLTDDDNYVLTGDFNLNPNYGGVTYHTLPSGLPGTYALGGDYPLPITFSTNPLAYFGTPGAARLDPRQLNGSAVTYSGGAGYTLDLFLVSPAIAARPYDTEIYNSVLDISNGTGLPKAGAPLASGTSATASDHFAVFADLELDSDLPDLDLALSSPSLHEGLTDGTVALTVTLPAIRPGAVTVSISSDDPGAVPVAPSVVIPAGSLSGNVAVRAPRNFIADPPRVVTFTATASGYDPDSSLLNLHDADGPYVIASAGQPVTEAFNGFSGDHDPAPWATTGGLTWRGGDDGASPISGLRSYGTAGDGSLGILPDGTGTTATATFVNQSGATLTGLQVAFDIEQWRAALNGAADRLDAGLFFNGQPIPLPELSHVASQSLPTGAIAGGLTTAKATTLNGLSIPPGATFELRVTFTPGAGSGALPADVFVNEFHYDNSGVDTGEFVEMVVGPGYSGPLSGISLVLYNGSGGTSYGTHTLDTFTAGATAASGHRLFSKPISGIQNDTDGFAVVAGGSVLHFISYEGSFTATDGPASGMTSVNIGVSQSGSETAGQAALGLTGSGGNAVNFTWQKFTGVAHSPGQPNQGQTFSLPALPPQGLAIDNVRVTAVAAGDFDQDGQTDADELAFGTDPFDGASIFRPVIVRSGGLALSFPGAAGIDYTVEWSLDLEDWEDLSSHAGNGQVIVVPLPEEEAGMFFRVRAGE